MEDITAPLALADRGLEIVVPTAACSCARQTRPGRAPSSSRSCCAAGPCTARRPPTVWPSAIPCKVATPRSSRSAKRRGPLSGQFVCVAGATTPTRCMRATSVHVPTAGRRLRFVLALPALRGAPLPAVAGSARRLRRLSPTSVRFLLRRAWVAVLTMSTPSAQPQSPPDAASEVSRLRRLRTAATPRPSCRRQRVPTLTLGERP